MKFEDIIFLVQGATGLAGMLTANPLITASGEGIARLLRIARNAYVSGKARGEWTPEQEKQWDEEIFPAITSQAHWKDE